MSAAKRVMIIEDDNDIRGSIAELLTDAGIPTIQAENGLQALNLLAQGEMPALILLDLMMPVMDGFKFREQQLIDPKVSGIPVIVMSADGNVADKQARTAALAYLRKPIDIQDLLEVVKKQLS